MMPNDKMKIDNTRLKSILPYRMNFVHNMSREKLDWAGPIEWYDEETLAFRMTNCFLKEGRKVGRNEMRWVNKIVRLPENNIYHRIAWNRRK